MTKHPKTWGPLVAALALLGPALQAQPIYLEPGSVLIYPVVDSRRGAGTGTVISVTNTNGNISIEPNTQTPFGTTQVRFYYATFAGQGPGGWQLTDIPELLTPNDILTVLAGDHNPQTELGWLFIVAEDPETEELIDFDYLVGDEVVVDTSENESVSFPAMAFQSLSQENNPVPGLNARSSLGYWFADRAVNGGNANNAADFNGLEYVRWPNEILLSSFLELSNLTTQGADLIFLSPLGADFRVGLRFLIYDNEEDQFSRTFTFFCWTQVPLQNISSVVRNLHGGEDPRTPPEELDSGWMRVSGDVAVNPITRYLVQDPPFVGAVVQRVIAPGANYEFGHLLHHSGRNSFNHNLPSTPLP